MEQPVFAFPAASDWENHNMRLNLVWLFIVWLLVVAMESSRLSADDPKPQPLVTISKETTFLTEPLDEEGYVDYLAALNQMQSKGVTPENNAAVPLRRALGLMDLKDSPKARNRYDMMLGIEPAGPGVYVTLAEIAKKHVRVNVDDAEEQMMRTLERCWKSEEFPLVADWIDQNEAALELIETASKRTRIYSPYLPAERPPHLIAMQMPGVHESRAAARLLVARATRHAGEGREEQALSDLLACHRLARLVKQDATLIGGLVGFAIDSTACYGDAAVLDSRICSTEQLATYLGNLDRLPPSNAMAAQVDMGERLIFLDVVVELARGQVHADEQNFPWDRALTEKIKEGARNGIEWDLILRDANRWYDRLHIAISEPDYSQQKSAIEKILKEADQGASTSNRVLNSLQVLLSPKEEIGTTIARQIGDVLVARLIPTIVAASPAEIRFQTQFDLTRVAIALEIHRVDQGAFPDSLRDLQVAALGDVPLDRFTGKSLHYQRRGVGYLLYSVGPNGQDDHATSYFNSILKGEHAPDGSIEIDAGDDLVIRLPLEK